MPMRVSTIRHKKLNSGRLCATNRRKPTRYTAHGRQIEKSAPWIEMPGRVHSPPLVDCSIPGPPPACLTRMPKGPRRDADMRRPLLFPQTLQCAGGGERVLPRRF